MPSSSQSAIPSAVELVVVHGMGRQTAGQTLLEWAEPILQRMDWIAKGNPTENGATTAAQQKADESALRSPDEGIRDEFTAANGLAEAGDDSQGEPTAIEFDSVVLGTPGDDQVTASVAYLDLEGTPRRVTLHVSEARWSGAFIPLTRTQIFNWGLTFVFRAVGRLLRYLSTAFWVTSRGFLGVGRVVAIVAIAMLWLVAGIFTVVAVVFLAISGPLLLLPFVGPLLKPVVNVLVDFVGDVPAWTQRPTRAAAMRQIVAGAIAAARARAGVDGRVIVVAHSEGAAITANLMFGDCVNIPGFRVDALATVGSALSLLGRPSFTSRRLTAIELAARGRSVRLNPVRAWAAMDDALRPRWLDFFATWDVVPSGPTSTGPDARRERWEASYSTEPRSAARMVPPPADSSALGPEEHPVHNTASAFSDHQSYSANIVQVIDPLARVILGMETGGGSPATESGTPRPLAAASIEQNRLHVRGVKELALNRLLVLVLAALSFLLPTFATLLGVITQGPAEDISTVLRWVFRSKDGEGFGGWLTGVPWVPYAILIAGIAALLLWLNGSLWQRFERRLASSRYDHIAVPRLRWWGIVVRVPLVLALALVLSIAGGGQPLLFAALITAAVALIGAPSYGRIPRIVRARVSPPR
ncbi:MAG: hypothetical protein V4531_00130 [Actinomycetota bacterium]